MTKSQIREVERENLIGTGLKKIVNFIGLNGKWAWLIPDGGLGTIRAFRKYTQKLKALP